MVTGAMCTKRKFYLLFLFLNWQLLWRRVGSSLPLESRKGLTRDVIDVIPLMPAMFNAASKTQIARLIIIIIIITVIIIIINIKIIIII